jgi:hypothetical protein
MMTRIRSIDLRQSTHGSIVTHWLDNSKSSPYGVSRSELSRLRSQQVTMRCSNP